MIDQGTYFVWLLLIDAIVLVLAWFAVVQLQRGQLKTLYLLFLLAGTLWVNLIYCVKYSPLSDDLAVLFSRGIFISILLTVIGFGCFIISFCSLQREFKHPRFYVFMFVNAGLVVAASAGYVESGIVRTAAGLAPVYGPLHPVLVASNFAMGFYVFWLAIRAFRASTDSIFRDQMRILFACCLFTFVWAGLMNGILPVILGSSRYSHIGPMGFLVLYAGILWIVLEQRTLFVSRDLNALLRQPAFRSQANVIVLKQLLLTLKDLVSITPAPMFRKILPFKLADQSLDLNVSHGVGGMAELPSHAGQIQGFADNVRVLEEHNRRLVFALIEAQGKLRDDGIQKTLETTSRSLPVARGNEHKVAEFSAEVERNRNEMKDSYGIDVPVFSTLRRELLVKIKRYAPTSLTPLFVGEPGSGRYTCASAMHHLRGGRGLMDVSLSNDLADVREQLAVLKTSGPDVGLFIRDLQSLSPEHWRLLDPVLKGGRRCYFCCEAETLEDTLTRIPVHARSALTQLRFEVPPLRSTPEDIFFTCIDLVARRSGALSRSIEGISREFIRQLRRARWHGNFPEFRAFVEFAIVSSAGNALNWELTGSTGREAPLLPDVSDLSVPGLSPLESAERYTILQFLEKNNFNQRKTSEDLDIRPNTLIVKMRKYGIQGIRPRAGRPRLAPLATNPI